MKTLSGIILKAHSGFFTVHTEAGAFICQLRGRLKKVRRSGDLAAIGDRVEISTQPDGAGMIEAILPRRSVLLRRAPFGGKRVKEEKDKAQVIIANADMLEDAHRKLYGLLLLIRPNLAAQERAA